MCVSVILCCGMKVICVWLFVGCTRQDKACVKSLFVLVHTAHSPFVRLSGIPQSALSVPHICLVEISLRTTPLPSHATRLPIPRPLLCLSPEQKGSSVPPSTMADATLRGCIMSLTVGISSGRSGGKLPCPTPLCTGIHDYPSR